MTWFLGHTFVGNYGEDMSKTPILFYQVVPGELTVVTGVPNSGKSEWIDALICNLNKSSGWKFALCSMENQVSSVCHQSVLFSFA